MDAQNAPSNKLWAVEIDQNGQDYHLCMIAWKEYAESQHLAQSGILIFCYLGVTADLCRLSVFDVKLYDNIGLAKGRCPPFPPVVQSNITHIDAEEKEGIDAIVPPTQSARIKKRFITEAGGSKDSQKLEIKCYE